MERGLFVTFFETGESSDRELPPVGPLDHLVVRHRRLVADRRGVSQAPELGVDIARWLEAELELQRALGEEPGGPKRGELRVSASDGVFLRFAAFGERADAEPLPELGPYAVVVVGAVGVEADGTVLATRGGAELASWVLTAAVGADALGRHMPDIAFRSPTTSYHAQVMPRGAPAAPEPVMTRQAEEPPALMARDLERIQRVEEERAADTLRARVLEEERRRVYQPPAQDTVVERPLLPARPTTRRSQWRVGIVLVGVLLLLLVILAGAYGLTMIRG